METATTSVCFVRTEKHGSRQSVNLSHRNVSNVKSIFFIGTPTPTPIEIGSLSEKGPAIEETRGLLRRLGAIWSSVIESTRFLTPRVPLVLVESFIVILSKKKKKDGGKQIAFSALRRVENQNEMKKGYKKIRGGRFGGREMGEVVMTLGPLVDVLFVYLCSAIRQNAKFGTCVGEGPWPRASP